MRLERLEIFGFKSFMERLILPLETGITGVVGPNGCGKSNVIDALRWVLGETRASQLRGGVLEDVIFNGTESLRPLGLAEVSVVIRADKASLFEDLLANYEAAELSTGGEPKEAATGEEEAVVADEGAEVVEAGAAAETGAAPEAMTADLESSLEAAQPANSDLPVVELPSAVDSSENGQPAGEVGLSSDILTDIRASLSKYAWLRGVSEVQVTRRLYRSGESEFFINKVQCRLKDLKELFRVLGMAARGYTIIAQGEIGRIITAKPDDRRAVIEEAAHIAGFREHMNAVSKRLEDTQGQVVRLDDVLKEVTRSVANLKRQAARAVARAEMKEELVTSERSLFQDTLTRLSVRAEESAEKLEAIAIEEAKALEALEESRANESGAREGLESIEGEVEQLRSKNDTLKEELSRRNREVSIKESRLREVNSVIQARSTEIRRLEERRVTLLQRRGESEEALKRLQESEGEIAGQLSSLDLSGEEELKQINTELQALREAQRGKDRTVRELRDKLVSAQSRRDALQSQITASSPLTHLKRALGGEHKMPPEIINDCKLLVDGIKVPGEYTKALQSVLAERASFLVVGEVASVARTFQELVLKADPDNKKGIGLGLFAAIPVEQIEPTTVPAVEGIAPMLSLVETLPWSAGIVQRLLQKVWVAQDLDVALKVIETLKSSANGAGADPETVVVTRSGDLLSPWSFYSLRHDGGVIQIKSKVDEAEHFIAENQGAYDAVVAERDEIISKIQSSEARATELVRAIQQAQARLRELTNRQAEFRGRLQSESRMLQQLDGDLQRIEPQVAEMQAQIESLEATAAEVAEEVAELKSRDNSELEEVLQQQSDRLRELDERRRSIREASAQLLRNVELRRQGYEGIRERLLRERMTGERLRGDYAAAQASIVERFGEELLGQLVEASKSMAALDEIARRELEQRVTGLRQRLEREGEVDPTVVEQHEQESQRLEDLTRQREDLVKAAETLQAALVEISEACTRRFTATFETIRKNFAYFGPKLFGGGSAELSLVDPTRPLETGVEIFVRPPGKKPKGIDLLSGGEKALCAIALVFSMFMVRPSPICVLDEVDAPLDEANVHRFAAFIKEMSARTQFLMITHNKQSMAAADTLVGVTMPQPGASKVLTVSLQEAVKQVA
jgi:chromosome segregation protein